MNLEDLNEGQGAKVAKCTSPEEVLELAKKEGYELSDDEIEQIVGGSAWDHARCPFCGSYWRLHRVNRAQCLNCGYEEDF